MVKRRTLITVLLVLGMVLPAAAHEVGWILMVPPMRTPHPPQAGIFHSDISAPLSKWKADESFDTARECEAVRETARKYAEKKQDERKHWKEPGFYPKYGAPGIYLFERYLFGRCVPASAVYPQAKEK